MSKKSHSSERIRLRIRRSIRRKIKGTPERPRLSVYRSNSNIFAQLIDDVNGVNVTFRYQRATNSQVGATSAVIQIDSSGYQNRNC